MVHHGSRAKQRPGSSCTVTGGCLRGETVCVYDTQSVKMLMGDDLLMRRKPGEDRSILGPVAGLHAAEKRNSLVRKSFRRRWSGGGSFFKHKLRLCANLGGCFSLV